jgi:hypothetical protein
VAFFLGDSTSGVEDYDRRIRAASRRPNRKRHRTRRNREFHTLASRPALVVRALHPRLVPSAAGDLEVAIGCRSATRFIGGPTPFVPYGRIDHAIIGGRVPSPANSECDSFGTSAVGAPRLHGTCRTCRTDGGTRRSTIGTITARRSARPTTAPFRSREFHSRRAQSKCPLFPP